MAKLKPWMRKKWRGDVCSDEEHNRWFADHEMWVAHGGVDPSAFPVVDLPCPACQGRPLDAALPYWAHFAPGVREFRRGMRPVYREATTPDGFRYRAWALFDPVPFADPVFITPGVHFCQGSPVAWAWPAELADAYTLLTPHVGVHEERAADWRHHAVSLWTLARRGLFQFGSSSRT